MKPFFVTQNASCMVLFAIISLVTASTFVDNVEQNYKQRMNNAVVLQIFSYSQSSLLYTAYASYFDRADVDLPGFKKLFTDKSKDCLQLAQNLTEIVNDRGGHVKYQDFKLNQICDALRNKQPPNMDLGRDSLRDNQFPKLCIFLKESQQKPSYPITVNAVSGDDVEPPAKPNALDALLEALVLERITNDELMHLMKQANRLKDAVMRVKLDNYLEHQVDILYDLGNLITRLRSYSKTHTYPLGEYLLDSEIQE